MPILLIDDNVEDYRAMKRCFTQLGFTNRLLYCDEGKKALHLLLNTRHADLPDVHQQKPGCVLLNLNMPEMDGREVFRIIKTDSTLKRTPVIMYSSSSDKEDIQNCYQNGANAYMVKPSDYDSLHRAMELFLAYWGEVTLPPK